MEIYVVQQGDTIASIALKFGISSEKLISDNDIKEPYRLAVGQTLVITHPLQVYTVKQGDTVAGIAEANQVSIMQLLRNNPNLVNREYIYPDEILVISYDNSKGSALVVGYTYPFIRDDILNKTLPYLTYMLMFNYRISENGELIQSDEDVEVIQTAKLFDTACTLVVTAFSVTGEINTEIVDELLQNKNLQDKIIDNLLVILKTKGYNGVNLAFQFVNTTNEQLYLDYLTNVTNKLHPEGYYVFLTFNPELSLQGEEVTFEKINYTEFSNISDGILFLSYDWGTISRPPIQLSIVTASSLLDYIVAQVPLEKIRIGLPTVGYDWTLPYVEGKSKANALNFDSILELAIQTNSEIKYNEKTLLAYFEYVDSLNKSHIVWFRDARSIDSSMKILKSYGIKGIGIWNIMYYFAQMWQVINTQYQIIKL